ncbi:chemokine-binding protein [Pseudocowpox virus]
MKAVVFLALLGAFANTAPLFDKRPDSAEKEKFCLTHHEEVYARFRLQMRVGVRHSPLYDPSNMCMLDIEDSVMGKEYTSDATGDAYGVNVSVALMGESVHIPLNYIGLGFNPLIKDGYLYVNVSSHAPWVRQTSDLAANGGWGINQVINKEILAIQIGCDNQKFPEPTTTQPPSTTTPSPTTPVLKDGTTDTTPTPTASVHRKRNPDDIDFSLLVDTRCVTSVDLHFEIKDACTDYKQNSPLFLRGKYGDGEQVRKEIKDLGKNHTMCRLNLSPDF